MEKNFWEGRHQKTGDKGRLLVPISVLLFEKIIENPFELLVAFQDVPRGAKVVDIRMNSVSGGLILTVEHKDIPVTHDDKPLPRKLTHMYEIQE